VWRRACTRPAAQARADGTAPAVLGMAGGSGVIAVTGDRRAARRLAHTLMTLLEGVPQHRVLVAAGTLPATPGQRLCDLLDRIDDIPERDAAARTFLFCAAPAPADAVRLRLLAARDQRLTAIALGALPGADLTMHVAAGGRLTIDRLAGADSLVALLSPHLATADIVGT
jgi:hypothetical protein